MARIHDNIVRTFIDGQLVEVGPPKSDPNCFNFLILWQGHDWSGFLSLASAEEQLKIHTLGITHTDPRLNDYDIVERI